MSWLFSQALVEAYLEDTSSDGEPSAPLNGNPIPQAYCAPDKMTGFSRLSRFGMTFKPLTESRGEELLTLYLAGFPARTSALRGGGAGITGSRSSMWKHMARIIGEVRPQYAFIENSPMLTIRGLETVLCDLAALGFNARWGVVSAADVGAPHLRERIWIVAHSINGGHREEVGRFDEAEAGIPKEHREEWGGRGMLVGAGNLERNRPADRLYDSGEVIPDASSAGLQGGKEARNDGVDGAQSRNKQSAGRGGIQKPRWPIEPNVGRVLSPGVAARMDRLKAIGNGQVPRVAATAWRLLK